MFARSGHAFGCLPEEEVVFRFIETFDGEEVSQCKFWSKTAGLSPKQKLARECQN